MYEKDFCPCSCAESVPEPGRLQQQQQQRQQEGKQETAPAQEEQVPTPPLNGQVLVFCAPDWSAAWGFVLPALGDGEPVTWETVLSTLEERKVTFGIDQEAVNRLSCKEYLFVVEKGT